MKWKDNTSFTCGAVANDAFLLYSQYDVVKVSQVFFLWFSPPAVHWIIIAWAVCDSAFFPVHTLLWRTLLSNWFCNFASHCLCVHIEYGRPCFLDASMIASPVFSSTRRWNDDESLFLLFDLTICSLDSAGGALEASLDKGALTASLETATKGDETARLSLLMSEG